MPGQADEIAEVMDRLRRTGWSIGSTAYATKAGGILWAVDGWNGENVIRADGATEVEAWRAAVCQARGLGMLGDVRAGTDPGSG